MSEDVVKHSVHTLVFRSLKRSHDMFVYDEGKLPPPDEKSLRTKMDVKAFDQYGPVLGITAINQPEELTNNDIVDELEQVDGTEQGEFDSGQPGFIIGGSHPYPSEPGVHLSEETALVSVPTDRSVSTTLEEFRQTQLKAPDGSSVADIHRAARLQERINPNRNNNRSLVAVSSGKQLIERFRAPTTPKPQWHPPWKLYRVISGHTGWVRCMAVDVSNQWFCTGSNDRMIKIWDLATGTLKLTLTGHVSTVRGVAVSGRHPYLFSCGEDKTVKCWDLEYNKVVRHYHGHLSACYALDLHPAIDVLVTCGRDATARVWDIRSKACIHTLTGHTNTVADVQCQVAEPQVITGSHDSTIRIWDLAAGKSRATLTNHKKSVRSLVFHPKLYMFASASPDNIKQWKCPDGNFIQNLTGHNRIINSLAINQDNVLVSGGDDGSLTFWDWKTGYLFQRIHSPVQPGSLESESGIYSCGFDNSGSRLITTDADKTIKVYKEDDSATEETHPVVWKPEIIKTKSY